MSRPASLRRNKPGDDNFTLATEQNTNKNQSWYRKLCRTESPASHRGEEEMQTPSPQRLQLQMLFQREYQQQMELQKNCRQEWWQKKSGPIPGIQSQRSLHTPSPAQRVYAGTPHLYPGGSYLQHTPHPGPREKMPQPSMNACFQQAPADGPRRHVNNMEQIPRACPVQDKRLDRELMIKAAHMIKHDVEKQLRETHREVAPTPRQQGSIQQKVLQILTEQELAEKYKTSGQIPRTPRPTLPQTPDLQHKIAKLIQAYQEVPTHQLSATYQTRQDQVATYNNMLQAYRLGNLNQSYQQAKLLLQQLLRKEPSTAQLSFTPVFYPPHPQQQACYPQQPPPPYGSAGKQPIFRTPYPRQQPVRTRRDPRLNQSTQQYQTRDHDITPRLNQSSYQVSEQDISQELIYQAQRSRKPGSGLLNSTPEEQPVDEKSLEDENGNILPKQDEERQCEQSRKDKPPETSAPTRDFKPSPGEEGQESRERSVATTRSSSAGGQQAESRHQDSGTRPGTNGLVHDWEQLQQRSQHHRRGRTFRYNQQIEEEGQKRREELEAMRKGSSVLSTETRDRKLATSDKTKPTHHGQSPGKSSVLPAEAQEEKTSAFYQKQQKDQGESRKLSRVLSTDTQDQNHFTKSSDKSAYVQNQTKTSSVEKLDERKSSELQTRDKEVGSKPLQATDSDSKATAAELQSSVCMNSSARATETGEKHELHASEETRGTNSLLAGELDAQATVAGPRLSGTTKSSVSYKETAVGQKVAVCYVARKSKPPLRRQSSGPPLRDSRASHEENKPLKFQQQAHRDPRQSGRDSQQQGVGTQRPPRTSYEAPRGHQLPPQNRRQSAESRRRRSRTKGESGGDENSPSSTASSSRPWDERSPGSTASKFSDTKSPRGSSLSKLPDSKSDTAKLPSDARCGKSVSTGSPRSTPSPSSNTRPKPAAATSPSDRDSKAEASPRTFKPKRRGTRRRPAQRDQTAAQSDGSAPTARPQSHDRNRYQEQQQTWRSSSPRRRQERRYTWAPTARRRPYQSDWDDTRAGPAKKFRAVGQQGRNYSFELDSRREQRRERSDNRKEKHVPQVQLKTAPRAARGTTGKTFTQKMETPTDTVRGGAKPKDAPSEKGKSPQNERCMSDIPGSQEEEKQLSTHSVVTDHTANEQDTPEAPEVDNRTLHSSNDIKHESVCNVSSGALVGQLLLSPEASRDEPPQNKGKLEPGAANNSTEDSTEKFQAAERGDRVTPKEPKDVENKAPPCSRKGAPSSNEDETGSEDGEERKQEDVQPRVSSSVATEQKQEVQPRTRDSAVKNKVETRAGPQDDVGEETPEGQTERQNSVEGKQESLTKHQDAKEEKPESRTEHRDAVVKTAEARAENQDPMEETRAEHQDVAGEKPEVQTKSQESIEGTPETRTGPDDAADEKPDIRIGHRDAVEDEPELRSDLKDAVQSRPRTYGHRDAVAEKEPETRLEHVLAVLAGMKTPSLAGEEIEACDVTGGHEVSSRMSESEGLVGAGAANGVKSEDISVDTEHSGGMSLADASLASLAVHEDGRPQRTSEERCEPEDNPEQHRSAPEVEQQTATVDKDAYPEIREEPPEPDENREQGESFRPKNEHKTAPTHEVGYPEQSQRNGTMGDERKSGPFDTKPTDEPGENGEHAAVVQDTEHPPKTCSGDTRDADAGSLATRTTAGSDHKAVPEEAIPTGKTRGNQTETHDSESLQIETSHADTDVETGTTTVAGGEAVADVSTKSKPDAAASSETCSSQKTSRLSPDSSAEQCAEATADLIDSAVDGPTATEAANLDVVEESDKETASDRDLHEALSKDTPGLPASVVVQPVRNPERDASGRAVEEKRMNERNSDSSVCDPDDLFGGKSESKNDTSETEKTRDRDAEAKDIPENAGKEREGDVTLEGDPEGLGVMERLGDEEAAAEAAECQNALCRLRPTWDPRPTDDDVSVGHVLVDRLTVNGII